MKFIQSRLVIFKDLLTFLWKRKMWWVIPFIFVMVLMGMILALSHGSVIAPFIYTLF